MSLHMWPPGTRRLIDQLKPMKLFRTGPQDMQFAHLLCFLLGFPPDSFMDHRLAV